MPTQKSSKLNRLHEKLNLDSHGDAVRATSGLPGSGEGIEQLSLYNVNDLSSEDTESPPTQIRKLSRRLSSFNTPKAVLLQEEEDRLVRNAGSKSFQNDILFHSITNSSASDALNETISLSDDQTRILEKEVEHKEESVKNETNLRRTRQGVQANRLSYRDMIRKDVSPETRRKINLKEIEDHFKSFAGQLKGKIGNVKSNGIKFSLKSPKSLLRKSSSKESTDIERIGMQGSENGEHDPEKDRSGLVLPLSRLVSGGNSRNEFHDEFGNRKDPGSSFSSRGRKSKSVREMFTKNDLMQYRPWRKRRENSVDSGMQTETEEAQLPTTVKRDPVKAIPKIGIRPSLNRSLTEKNMESSGNLRDSSQNLFKSESLNSINSETFWMDDLSSDKPNNDTIEYVHDGSMDEGIIQEFQKTTRKQEEEIARLSLVVDSLKIDNSKLQKSLLNFETEIEQLLSEIGRVAEEKTQSLIVEAERKLENRISDCILSLEKKIEYHQESPKSRSFHNNRFTVAEKEHSVSPVKVLNPSNSLSEHALSWFILGIQTILLPIMFLYSFFSNQSKKGVRNMKESSSHGYGLKKRPKSNHLTRGVQFQSQSRKSHVK